MKTKTLNKFTKLLNELEKEYTVRTWESGKGTDIVIPHYKDVEIDKPMEIEYNIIISINDTDYVDFEWEEVK